MNCCKKCSVLLCLCVDIVPSMVWTVNKLFNFLSPLCQNPVTTVWASCMCYYRLCFVSCAICSRDPVFSEARLRKMFNICSFIVWMINFFFLLQCHNRGSVHPAAVLGAAAMGGPASERFPSLSLSEWVATQGKPEPENPPPLQQGEGKFFFTPSLPTALIYETSV